jgi:hypothetical protein
VAYGYIPKTWRQIRVKFIAKPGKASYTEAKAYRPISLSFFLLNTMEKVVDRYIRYDVMSIRPLYRNQFAHQTGRSTKTALHNVVMRTEDAVAYEEIALGAFLDIEEASGRTSFDVITETAERHWLESTIARWIKTMLESRSITATLFGETLEVSATKGLSAGVRVIAPAVEPDCKWASRET